VQFGNEENFLKIEPKPIYGSELLLKIEAVATAFGCRFSAVNVRVVLDSSEETKRKFADFASLNIAEFELRISESGWIRFNRNGRGHVTLSYRIANRKASAAMEGEVIVEGEFTRQLYSDLSALLGGKP
jgi:hypothetical protein